MYSIRNIPSDVVQALRRVASEQHKSLNQVAIETLQQALSTDQPIKRRDLADIVGAWREDRRIDETLADQCRIDPELWG